MGGMWQAFLCQILCHLQHCLGANAERSNVVIDPSRSFLFVRLRSTKIHSTLANIVHGTVVKYGTDSRYCSKILY
jgi:hypothetical protein